MNQLRYLETKDLIMVNGLLVGKRCWKDDNNRSITDIIRLFLVTKRVKTITLHLPHTGYIAFPLCNQNIGLPKL